VAGKIRMADPNTADVPQLALDLVRAVRKEYAAMTDRLNACLKKYEKC
jgi:hypothetical protein